LNWKVSVGSPIESSSTETVTNFSYSPGRKVTVPAVAT